MDGLRNTLLILFLVNACYSSANFDAKHLEVALRMIGHQVLLKSGDSTSRVLPILKNEYQFEISFEKEFAFNPDELASTINKIVQESKIAEDYIVEVKSCTNKQTVYSYEVNSELKDGMIPCRLRDQPQGCYKILFTVLKRAEFGVGRSKVQKSSWKIIMGLIGFGVIVFAVLFIRKLKRKKQDFVSIGQYNFNEKSMELYFKKDVIELTEKEGQLLCLFFENKNETLTRDMILNAVWDDEGDYIGRTLDVYVSKLRKKLDKDDQLKIINVRGVGYKLLIN